jgi:hypothetical protein
LSLKMYLFHQVLELLNYYKWDTLCTSCIFKFWVPSLTCLLLLTVQSSKVVAFRFEFLVVLVREILGHWLHLCQSRHHYDMNCIF